MTEYIFGYRGKVPNRERMISIYTMHEEGRTISSISHELGDSRAYQYLRNPGKYDPYIDEVAMSRAMRGDIEVIKNLSVFEWFEFLDRMRPVQLQWFAQYQEKDGGQRHALDHPGNVIFGEYWDKISDAITNRYAKRERRARKASDRAAA